MAAAEKENDDDNADDDEDDGAAMYSEFNDDDDGSYYSEESNGNKDGPHHSSSMDSHPASFMARRTAVASISRIIFCLYCSAGDGKKRSNDEQGPLKSVKQQAC
jgi:hypothetical protein